MVSSEPAPSQHVLRCADCAEARLKQIIIIMMEIETSNDECDNPTQLMKRCVEFYAALKADGLQVSCSMKVESNQLTFTLKSMNEETPKRNKRPPSYYLRQRKRKQAFLKRKAEFSSGKEMTTGGTKKHGNVCEPGGVDLLKEKTSVQTQTNKDNQETAESDEYPELDLCPKPVHQRTSEGSVESETDTEDEVIQQEKSGQGAVNQKGPQVVQLVHDTPPVVRALRKLPAHFNIWAVPWLCDERHTLTRSDGSEVTVFASKWVPIEEIRRAIEHPIDWGVVRPTSRREDKWVFYPPEDQQ